MPTLVNLTFERSTYMNMSLFYSQQNIIQNIISLVTSRTRVTTSLVSEGK